MEHLQKLKRLANEYGGGLSYELTGKKTSIRHALAKEKGLLTAGEVAKILTKKLKVKIFAKDIKDYASEWHHSGFFKSELGKYQMGKTFFFTKERVEDLLENFFRYEEERKKRAEMVSAEEMQLSNIICTGYYWIWDYDYKGHYGKKRWFKVLKFYEGSKLDAPKKNFTEINNYDRFCELRKLFEGKEFFGWDEPNFDI